MVEPYRSIQLLPLVVAIMLCLFAGLYFARRYFAKQDSAGGVSRHSVDTPADETLKYWTADKMRKAKPAEMPKVSARDVKKRRPRRPPHKSGEEQA